MSEINIDLDEEPPVGVALSANQHHPTIYGKLGNPASMSEIVFSKMPGFK
jgi:hypothetical protein